MGKRRAGQGVHQVAKRVRYPCGDCNEACARDTILCGECNKWFHRTCQGLTEEDLSKLGSMSMDYVCKGCVSDSSGNFNYQAALQRLYVAGNGRYGALLEAIEREGLLMPKLMDVCMERKGVNGLVRDEIASATLGASGLECINRHAITAKTLGNGNCLFNAVSIWFKGNEGMAHELRLRAAVEMLVNKDRYLEMPKVSEYNLLSPSYESSVADCAIDGGYSSVWTIAALATVIGHNIRVVYPPMNGPGDLAFRCLHGIIEPLQQLTRPQEEIIIMWTNLGHYKGGLWTPNHFVPVIPKRKMSPHHFEPIGDIVKQSATKDIMKSTCVLHDVSENQAHNRSHRTEGIAECEFVNKEQGQDKSDATSEVISKADSVEELSELGSDSESVDSEEDRYAYLKEQDMDREFQVLVSDSYESERDSDEVEEGELDEVEETNDVTEDLIAIEDELGEIADETLDEADKVGFMSFKKAPGGREASRFLTVAEILEVIRDVKIVDVIDKVPAGDKGNMYFIVDNKENFDRRQEQLPSIYHDDCGVWDTKKSKTERSYNILDDGGRPVPVYLKGGLYTKEGRSKGKKVYTPIHPQPDSDRVIVVIKHTAVLKRASGFKKRVVWLESEREKSIAIWQYVGDFPSEQSVHGNAKRSGNHYVRTDPEVMKDIKAGVFQKAPTELFLDLQRKFPDNAARSVKQIKDVKHKARNMGSNRATQSNVADEVLEVLGMLQDQPRFVQRVYMNGDSPPSVICYFKETIADIRSFLAASEDQVLGVDRTFNLGKCFVTTIVYKSLKVLRKESNDHPILFGPMLIHWDGRSDTYHEFFAHVRSMLATELQVTDIKVGSDDEKALTRALDSIFPNATRYLCTKHLKDNLSEYLKNKVGITQGTRKKMVDEVFGRQGLVSLHDTLAFEEKASAIRQDHLEQFPDFVSYFDNQVKGRIFEYVVKPNRKNPTTSNRLWTNNNCESLNHVLKQVTKWQPKKTPDLVRCLYDAAHIKLLDIRSSLHGMGNYRIVPWLTKKFYVPHNVWLTKDIDQRDKLFHEFCAYKKTTKPKIVSSSDGKLKVPNVPRLAKKPGQRTRARAERAKPKQF